MVATIYHALGISHHAEIKDQLNRPIPLVRPSPSGKEPEPVNELWGSKSA